MEAEANRIVTSKVESKESSRTSGSGGSEGSHGRPDGLRVKYCQAD